MTKDRPDHRYSFLNSFQQSMQWTNDFHLGLSPIAMRRVHSRLRIFMVSLVPELAMTKQSRESIYAIIADVANRQEREGKIYRGAALRHPEVLERPTKQEGVFTFDLPHDGRE
jgi:hypothetical protein